MIARLQFTIKGQEFELPVEMSQQILEEMYEASASNVKRTGWEKPEHGETYYYENALGHVQTVVLDEDSTAQMEVLFRKANCYTSRALAEDIARGDELIRNLRRMASDTSASVDHQTGGYTITYNYVNKCLEPGATGPFMALGDIIFTTEEAVQNAITAHRDELLWYFTEMKCQV